MAIYILLTVFIISIILMRIVLPQILNVCYKNRLFDSTGVRKIHTESVPRLGGLSFSPIILCTILIVLSTGLILGYDLPDDMVRFATREYIFFITGLAIIFIMGVSDDFIGLRYRTKFAVQFMVGSFFPLSGLWLSNLNGLLGIYEISPWLGIPLTIFLVVFIINSINLIDGIDGLAAGLTIIALTALAYLFIINRAWMYAMIAFSTLGVLLVFYFYNVFGKSQNGKKIFMGDAGSLTLGYILAFLCLGFTVNYQNMIMDETPVLAMVFTPVLIPLFDAFRVMMNRMNRGKSPFIADNTHIHHKLLFVGLKTYTVRISLFILSICLITLNTLLFSKVDITILLFCDIFVWFIFVKGINYVPVAIHKTSVMKQIILR